MIKFRAKEESQNTGTIDSFIKNFSAIGSERLATGLNDQGIKLKCDLHPDFDSIVTVDMSNRPVVFEIDSVCCEEFRKKLLHFLEVQK